jgi:hypothetical protein
MFACLGVVAATQLGRDLPEVFVHTLPYLSVF